MLGKVLVANRGEIAIRICRTAQDLGIATVAVAPADDLGSRHVDAADEVVELDGAGPAAYLDVAGIVAAAAQTGCDAVHPGYGFLAENVALAAACEASGLIFVGPRPETLELFGDKTSARTHAQACSVPTPPGTAGATSLQEATAFLASLGGAAVMVKAVAGAAAGACAPPPMQRSWPTCGSGAGQRPPARSATVTCTSSACSTELAMSRSRSSATAQAAWRWWASASAASSANDRS